jgi:hypothetical protein
LAHFRDVKGLVIAACLTVEDQPVAMLGCVLSCSYHTVLDKTLSAGDLHDGMKLTTASQHELTVKVDK